MENAYGSYQALQCMLPQATPVSGLQGHKREGNPKKGRIWVYVQLIHFAVQPKLTQHWKATILLLKKLRIFPKWNPAEEILSDNPTEGTA